MKRFFLTLVVASAMLTGCAATQIVQTTTDYMESTASVLDPVQSMLLTPVIADLRVSDKKVHYTEKDAFANFEVTPHLVQNITELKKIALSRAARAHNADVLVCASIEVVTKKRRLEITVSGFPAHYVKFRNASRDDVELLKGVRLVESKDGANVVATSPSKLKVQVNN